MSAPTDPPEIETPPEPPAPEPRQVRLVVDGVPARRPISRRLLRWALFLGIGAANALVVLVVAGYLYYSRGLPEIPTVAEYRPPIITEMISSDGQIAGEFFDERRKVVPYERI